jgi:hypothetical protein
MTPSYQPPVLARQRFMEKLRRSCGLADHHPEVKGVTRGYRIPQDPKRVSPPPLTPQTVYAEESPRQARVYGTQW